VPPILISRIIEIVSFNRMTAIDCGTHKSLPVQSAGFYYAAPV